MKNTTLANHIRNLSSGTVSILIGAADYNTTDTFQNQWAAWAEETAKEYKTWQMAFVAFVGHKTSTAITKMERGVYQVSIGKKTFTVRNWSGFKFYFMGKNGEWVDQPEVATWFDVILDLRSWKNFTR